MLILNLGVVLIAAAVGADAAAKPGDATGTLVGAFVFNGPHPIPPAIATAGGIAPGLIDESLVVDKEGGIANVVVYVRTKNLKTPPAVVNRTKARVEVVSTGGQYTPRIVPLLVAPEIQQEFVVRNADPFVIDSLLTEIGGNGFNKQVTPGQQFAYKFDPARPAMLPLPLKDTIHPWYQAYVIRDNPYFAVSGKAGGFTIQGLPIGKLEFQVWHERAGNFKSFESPTWKNGRFELEIKPGKNDLGKIKLDPILFKK